MKKIIYLQDENGNFQKYEYENISDLNEEFKKRNIKLEYNCTLGDNCTLGYNKFFSSNNLYKYVCFTYINNKNEEIIQLGCFTRTRKEWEDDFWNNEKEFPNDNSDKSNARLRAFKMCCNFLDLIKK